MDCGPLNNITNGVVDTSSGTTFMKTATYTCYLGYMLVGDDSRTCQSNGEWSMAPPVCNGKGIDDMYMILSQVVLISPMSS